MGIEEFLDAAGGSKQFVTAEKFEEIIACQPELAHATLETLRHLEEKPSAELRLEFFFYTNSAGKAKEFCEYLRKKNYSADYEKTRKGKNLFSINGWTTKIPMKNETVIAWSKEMCESGFQYDCEFEGWGTTPDQ
jgi:hypothetical protein